jgi:hypothetical protein
VDQDFQQISGIERGTSGVSNQSPWRINSPTAIFHRNTFPMRISIWVVVWNIFHFPFHIWDVILPIDELIFFKMVKSPPTSHGLHPA